ncbi:alpha/beta fold hydrolase [Bacillus dakarensis]|uniref:alpha/beta fold hydrolase n=1 Tax=Robertmurraya dakarensis TaxID=1926278 RepID=UPI001F388A88|nr:alpha/beta fold hydrolase [Bacillus dakarensis]
MATETIPKIDFEKEIKRWNHFMNIIHESDPEVNPTPRQAVWKKNKATLWHYRAEEKKYDTPIFIIYSLINQPFILDLAPGSSVIEIFVQRGYDVYLLDWGIPGYEDKDINIDDYIVDYIQKGVRRALRHSGAEEISVLGYCLGGTFASIYAAIAKEPIKNLIVATVPIDFSVSFVPDKWAEGLRDGTINIDRFIDVYGVVPASYVEGMFRSITSPIYNSPYLTLLNRAYDKKFVEKWRRMNSWTSGHIPFAGEAFRQLNNDLYKENKLVKNEMTIRGERVHLGNINMSLLVVNAKHDHLVLEEQSLPLLDLVSSEDKTYELVEAGHISLALSGKLASIVNEWLASRSGEATTK